MPDLTQSIYSFASAVNETTTSTITTTWSATNFNQTIETVRKKRKAAQEKHPLKFKPGEKVRMIEGHDGFMTELQCEIQYGSYDEYRQRNSYSVKVQYEKAYIDKDNEIKTRIKFKSWTIPEDKLVPWIYDDGLDNWE